MRKLHKRIKELEEDFKLEYISKEEKLQIESELEGIKFAQEEILRIIDSMKAIEVVGGNRFLNIDLLKDKLKENKK